MLKGASKPACSRGRAEKADRPGIAPYKVVSIMRAEQPPHCMHGCADEENGAGWKEKKETKMDAGGNNEKDKGQEGGSNTGR